MIERETYSASAHVAIKQLNEAMEYLRSFLYTEVENISAIALEKIDGRIDHVTVLVEMHNLRDLIQIANAYGEDLIAEREIDYDYDEDGYSIICKPIEDLEFYWVADNAFHDWICAISCAHADETGEDLWWEEFTQDMIFDTINSYFKEIEAKENK